jgi:hypothetical protein
MHDNNAVCLADFFLMQAHKRIICGIACQFLRGHNRVELLAVQMMKPHFMPLALQSVYNSFCNRSIKTAVIRMRQNHRYFHYPSPKVKRQPEKHAV